MNKVPFLHSFWEWTVVLIRISSPCTEKFTEVKCNTFILISIRSLHLSTQIKSTDAQFWQITIWIVITWVLIIPFSLAALLHHIIPRVYVIILILTKEIIWGTGQLQHFFRSFSGFWFFKDILYIQTDFCLCPFMCFIVDDKIPVHSEHSTILLKFSPCNL